MREMGWGEKEEHDADLAIVGDFNNRVLFLNADAREDHILRLRGVCASDARRGVLSNRTAMRIAKNRQTNKKQTKYMNSTRQSKTE